MIIGIMFSSPIGAFIFLIIHLTKKPYTSEKFSSPIGAFIFLIKAGFYSYNKKDSFRPLSGLLFS